MREVKKKIKPAYSHNKQFRNLVKVLLIHKSKEINYLI